MGTRLLLPLAAVAVLSTAGCYTTWDIAPRNVNSLHVDPQSGQKVILADDGDAVVVDRDTELRFRTLGPRVAELDVKFESLDVYGGPAGLLRGPKGDVVQEPARPWWVAGVLRGDGRGIRVDMNQVTSLAVKRYSSGKTAALVVGAVLAAGAIAGAITGVLIASFASSD